MTTFAVTPTMLHLRHISARLFPRLPRHVPAVYVQATLFADGTANEPSGVSLVYAEIVRVFQDEAHVAYLFGILAARLVDVYTLDRVGGDSVRFALSGQEYLDGIPNDALDDPKRVLGEAAYHGFGFSVGYGESPVSPTNNPI